jgi:ARC6-like, IMS domain
MKKLSISVLLLAIVGCNNPSISQTSNSISGDCPEQPSVSLEEKDVKPITLTTSGTTQESGQVKSGKSLGYTFEGQAGQKLRYQTKDDICIWIFTQDLTILEGIDLPKNGKYTIQVAALKGATTFNLEMTLGNLAASSNPTPSQSPNQSTLSASPNPIPSQPPNQSNPVTPTSQVTPVSQFTENDAAQIVQSWLNAKIKLFAPPYDQSLATNLTTGDRYIKTVGAINWLKTNNAYYNYKLAKVDASGNFSVSSDKASIDVNITEDLTLYVNGKVDPQNTSNGPITKSYRFNFKSDGGTWKIETVDSL